jgi:hypothetical protein
MISHIPLFAQFQVMGKAENTAQPVSRYQR